MFSGQLGKILLQTLGVIAYARLLEPSAFGLVAMSMAIVGVAAVLRDFGLGQAAVQSRDLTEAHKTNLFWANTVIGGALALAVVVLSWPISALLNSPQSQTVMVAIAPVFFLGGMATQPRASLSRAMRFKTLARTEVGSQAFGLALGLSFAVSGFGFWSLVVQQLSEQAALLASSVVATRWRPRRYVRGASLRRFWHYGGPLAATQMLVYASQNIDSVLIGRSFGTHELGLWNRAFQLIMVPLNQLASPATKVALPVLARVQDESTAFVAYLLRAQLLVASGVGLALATAYATAPGLIEVLLGDGWERSATFLRILALGGCFQAVNYATFWCFLAYGRTRSNLKFTLTTRSITLCALIGASTHSVEAIAWAYSSCLGLTWLMGLWWVRSFAPSRRMLAQGTRIMCRAVAAAWAGLFVAQVTDLSALASAVPSACVAVLVYILLIMSSRDRTQIFETISLVRGRRK